MVVPKSEAVETSGDKGTSEVVNPEGVIVAVVERAWVGIREERFWRGAGRFRG